MTAVITYLTGDATQPAERPAVIAHVSNDVGGWGAGFTGALSHRWPQPEAEYRQWYRSVGLLLGTVHAVKVEPDLWVVNMVAQHGIGPRNGLPPIRYDALRECLAHVAGTARHLGVSLHMPRIGCGLGGGTWDRVEPIIRETCTGVPVFVYDLPTAATR